MDSRLVALSLVLDSLPRVNPAPAIYLAQVAGVDLGYETTPFAYSRALGEDLSDLKSWGSKPKDIHLKENLEKKLQELNTLIEETIPKGFDKRDWAAFLSKMHYMGDFSTVQELLEKVFQGLEQIAHE